VGEWFEKGYLDHEVMIFDENKSADCFLNAKSGIVFTWPASVFLLLAQEYVS